MERLEIPLKKRIERIDRGPALLDIDDVIDLKKVFDRLAAYEDAMPLERAQELARAEKMGRLVVLPCKVGDNVYQTDGLDIYKSKVQKIVFDTDNIAFDKDAIGKTVFLTREEAEAELKKREEAENEAD